MHHIALIGAGFIGRVHAGCIAASPRARLAAVHDVMPAAAEALAETCGATAASLEAILSDEAITAVIIAASTDAHGALARACVAAGKPYLCEKPLDLDVGSAHRTAAATAAAGLFAGIGFNRRFDRQHAALRRAVSAGEVGRIEMIHITSRSATPPSLDYVARSGGQLRDKGAHFFDLACWIANQRPVEIYAVGACLFEPGFAAHGDVDTAMIVMTMAEGALCHLNFSRRTAYGYDERIEVTGSAGMIQSRAPVPVDVALYWGPTIRSHGLHQDWYERVAATYAAQLEAFLDGLDGRADFPSVIDGLVAETIADAGMRSMTERRPVAIGYEQVDEVARMLGDRRSAG